MNPIEYLKFLSTIRERISDQCKQLLDKKWFVGSRQRITSLCSFCRELQKRCVDRPASCYFCICPPEMCGGGNSFILEMRVTHGHNKSGVMLVNELSENQLKRMISLIKRWIIENEDN